MLDYTFKKGDIERNYNKISNNYISLFKQGNKTAKARKELLVEQRKKLLEKQEDINRTIKRLDYKIEIYNDIISGKRKDFLENP